MTRVKRGVVTKQRHKRLFKETKGFWGQRKNIYKRAKETLMRAMAFAFKGRKLKKRTMRSLFITRINAGAAVHGMSYNAFIHGLKKTHVALNRKMLSQIAFCDAPVFEKLVSLAKQ